MGVWDGLDECEISRPEILSQSALGIRCWDDKLTDPISVQADGHIYEDLVTVSLVASSSSI